MTHGEKYVPTITPYGRLASKNALKAGTLINYPYTRVTLGMPKAAI